LRHLEVTALSSEVLPMLFLVDNARTSRHPLHVAWIDRARVSRGISMIAGALQRRAAGLKALTWRARHSPAAGTGSIPGGRAMGTPCARGTHHRPSAMTLFHELPIPLLPLTFVVLLSTSSTARFRSLRLRAAPFRDGACAMAPGRERKFGQRATVRTCFSPKLAYVRAGAGFGRCVTRFEAYSRRTHCPRTYFADANPAATCSFPAAEAPFAAFSMRSATACGCDTYTAWLPLTSTTVERARLDMAR